MAQGISSANNASEGSCSHNGRRMIVSVTLFERVENIQKNLNPVGFKLLGTHSTNSTSTVLVMSSCIRNWGLVGTPVPEENLKGDKD